MNKAREVTLSDLYLYEATGESLTPEEFEKMADKANKLLRGTKAKSKAKYMPFEQFLEENCVIRGQD